MTYNILSVLLKLYSTWRSCVMYLDWRKDVGLGHVTACIISLVRLASTLTKVPRLFLCQVPDYYEIIINPMDLSTMMTKIDLHKYQTVQQFQQDIDLICSNALEYNPDRDAQGLHLPCVLYQ